MPIKAFRFHIFYNVTTGTKTITLRAIAVNTTLKHKNNVKLNKRRFNF
jgi:hypothetical protein